jgi:hypothetical protein
MIATILTRRFSSLRSAEYAEDASSSAAESVGTRTAASQRRNAMQLVDAACFDSCWPPKPQGCARIFICQAQNSWHNEFFKEL